MSTELPSVPSQRNEGGSSRAMIVDGDNISKPKRYHHIYHPTIRKRKGLSIRFPDAYEEMVQIVCEIDSCMNLTDDDRKCLWHTRSDYHFSRSTARVIAKESERYGHSKQLDGVYIATYTDQVQETLNLWARHGHSRRGLERWANSHHGNVRKEDQYMHQQGVLRAQHELKLKEGMVAYASSCPSEERLREVGHVLSRKARLFAQMIGEADAEAAQWEYGMTIRTQPSHQYDFTGMKPTPTGAGTVTNSGLGSECGSGVMMSTAIPRIQPRRRNLGLSGGPMTNSYKVNRVADLPQPRKSNSVIAQQSRSSIDLGTVSTAPITSGVSNLAIKTRSTGRVPRMA
jgi:hypothetical protein